VWKPVKKLIAGTRLSMNDESSLRPRPAPRAESSADRRWLPTRA
jgi:hypothetical protein